MPTIPEDVAAILDDRVFVHLGTINPDGSPHVSVIWVERNGDRVLFGTADGRVKPRNLRRDPRVALSFTPPNDPYRSITMRGTVIDMRPNGTGLIDRLAHKYLGEPRFTGINPNDTRLDVTIEIDTVAG